MAPASSQAARAPSADRDGAPEHAPFPPVLLERVGFVVTMVKGAAQAICAEALAPLGIDVRQLGLLSVLATEGPHSQQELVDWIRLDRTTMVGLVDSLEDRGLLRRERNPKDRRAYLLQLTPGGRRAQRRGRELILEAEGRLLDSLEPGEREQLLELLGKVAAAIGRPPQPGLP